MASESPGQARAHVYGLSRDYLDVSTIGGVCLCCIGTLELQALGFWMALCILVVNLVGDTSNASLLKDWRTLIGLPVAGLMIVYLLRNHAIFS